MNTNTQRDTDAILQMGKDLEEARLLLAAGANFTEGFIELARLLMPTSPTEVSERTLLRMRDFLARTEPKGETK